MKSIKIILLGLILAVFFILSLHLSKKEQENVVANNKISDNSFFCLQETINKNVYDKCKRSIVRIIVKKGINVLREGSGVVVINPNTILTNYHVVSGADNIVVSTFDKTMIAGKVFAYDEENDIALLNININLPQLNFSKNDYQVGRNVFALSYIENDNLFLSPGIISSISRPIRDNKGRIVSGFISTDTKIMTGSSGSALLNTNGELLGLNYAVYSDKTSLGISYSIPIDFVNKIINYLINEKDVQKRGGVDFISADIQYDLRLNPNRYQYGVVVVGFVPGSSSEAVLSCSDKYIEIGDDKLYLGGDIITKLNDCEIQTIDDIYTSLADTTSGQLVNIEFFRNGKKDKGVIRLVNREKGYEKRFYK